MKIIRYLLLFVMYLCTMNNANAQGNPFYFYKDTSKIRQKTGFDGSKLSFESIQILATQQNIGYRLYLGCHLTTGEAVLIRNDEQERLKKIDWTSPIRIRVIDEISGIEIPIYSYRFKSNHPNITDNSWICSDITQIDEHEYLLNAFHVFIRDGGVLEISPFHFYFRRINGDK